MSLTAPNLDDLRFQRDLVDEARRRIIRYCPEWTDYNLSDPGITLIELFAWMTESMIYRFNKVPDKNYIKFMELVGLQLQPASSARTKLTFRLSAPFPLGAKDNTVAIVSPRTEVSSQVGEDRKEVIFTTDERLFIQAPKLTEFRRETEFHKNYLPRLGIDPFYTFSETRPAPGDTFYLGFDSNKNIQGHIIKLTFSCEQTQAVGIKRQDPPWVWECSVGDGQWQELQLGQEGNEKDSTGGLNNTEGSLVLYLPLSFQADQVNGLDACWVRCRIEQRRPEQGMYDESPRVLKVTAHTLGATTWGTHAVVTYNETMGYSDGTPDQSFFLQQSPVLALQDHETVEIEEKQDDDWVFVPWQRIPDFSTSTPYDRHFSLDTATGEVRFGPAIRQPNGTVRQYGRVPQANRMIRFNQYRYGGGAAGNLPSQAINLLRTSIPYVTQVVNAERAFGGRDQELLDEAKMRMQRELRAQLRAVTPEDYEDLAQKASREVARAKCNIPQNKSSLSPGSVEILVVPAVVDSLQVGDLSKLQVAQPLLTHVGAYLDNYRLLTTTLHIKEPNYVGVKVQAQIVPSAYIDPDLVKARVVEHLQKFICPLPLAGTDNQADNLIGPDWNGWEFGRNLYVAEIFSLIQGVAGVKHVLDVTLSQRQVRPHTEDDSQDELAALTEIAQKMIQVPDDTLLCSLSHEIIITELDD